MYLNPEKHGDNLARDAAQLLAQLKQAGDKVDVSALGDSFLLEHDFTAVPASEIAKQFGEEFAAKLGELPPGQWQGPVESGYGVHLVLISERTRRTPCPRWRKCATPCAASGTTPGGWKRTRSSTRNC